MVFLLGVRSLQAEILRHQKTDPHNQARYPVFRLQNSLHVWSENTQMNFAVIAPSKITHMLLEF